MSVILEEYSYFEARSLHLFEKRGTSNRYRGSRRERLPYNHFTFQPGFRRRIPMDKITRTSAKIAMEQSPRMYAVIHIKSSVIASRQPSRDAFLFFPSPLSSSSGLSTKGTFDKVEEKRSSRVPAPPSILLPLFFPFSTSRAAQTVA